MLIKDIGICLARRDYSESSQIATIFTCLNGKVRGLAKGARRVKSKFGGGIELLAQGEIVFSTGRGQASLATLTEWTSRQSYRRLRQNLQQLNRAYYLAELVDLFTEEFDPHQQLYDHLHRALEGLGQGQDWIGLLNFQVQLLEEVGLSPELTCCAACGKDAKGRPSKFLSFTAGGILCSQCQSAIPEKERIRPIGLRIIRMIRSFGAKIAPNKPKDEQSSAELISLTQANAPQAQDLLDYWIRSALNRQPKTAPLLR